MSLTNSRTSGSKGTNGAYQMGVIALLRDVAGIPSANDLHAIVDDIDDSVAHEVFPAVEGYTNIITDMLLTNAHATIGTKVELRETNASGRKLWKGFAKADGGGWTQTLKHDIVAGKGKSIVMICLTEGADVTLCVTGHKRKP